jgi:hypothetical protein
MVGDNVNLSGQPFLIFNFFLFVYIFNLKILIIIVPLHCPSTLNMDFTVILGVGAPRRTRVLVLSVRYIDA